MELSTEFVDHVRYKAIHKWKWRNPYLVAVLAFVHPLGMLLCSLPIAVVYFLAWLLMLEYWPQRPLGTGLLLGAAFGFVAYHKTKWKNAAIEKWKYSLEGTGKQNPKALVPLVHVDD